MLNAMKFVRDLREVGFESEQAEVIVDVIDKSLQHNFATSEDLAKLSGRVDLLDAKLDRVHHELDMKIDHVYHDLSSKMDKGFLALENRLMLKFGGMMAFGFSFLAFMINNIKH